MLLTFNEEGKVTRYTGGYVMDRTLGNTRGLGGLFGSLYTIGKGFPFPEGRPWSPSNPISSLQHLHVICGEIHKTRVVVSVCFYTSLLRVLTSILLVNMLLAF